MHLHELLGWPGPLTHRQFRAWQAWLELEQSRPSRADFYLMAIRYSIETFMAKPRPDFDSEQWCLKVGVAPPRTPKPKRDKAWLQRQKAMLFAAAEVNADPRT